MDFGSASPKTVFRSLAAGALFVGAVGQVAKQLFATTMRLCPPLQQFLCLLLLLLLSFSPR
jgi:ABC-type siderophore export system fused ATPase/permease subunit